MSTASKLTEIDLPWEWIGAQGTGQFPITSTQMEWLEQHGFTRSAYLDEVDRRRKAGQPLTKDSGPR